MSSPPGDRTLAAEDLRALARVQRKLFAWLVAQVRTSEGALDASVRRGDPAPKRECYRRSLALSRAERDHAAGELGALTAALARVEAGAWIQLSGWEKTERIRRVSDRMDGMVDRWSFEVRLARLRQTRVARFGALRRRGCGGRPRGRRRSRTSRSSRTRAGPDDSDGEPPPPGRAKPRRDHTRHLTQAVRGRYPERRWRP